MLKQLTQRFYIAALEIAKAHLKTIRNWFDWLEISTQKLMCTTHIHEAWYIKVVFSTGNDS